MCSSIQLFYIILLTLFAAHLATPEFGNSTEEPVNLDEVNDDLLKQIYKDIDKYTKNTYVTKNYLLNLKFNLQIGKGDILTKANVFKNEVESVDFAFLKTQTATYNEYECKYFGKNCKREEEDVDECIRHLLKKNDYIESINIFIDLLFIDFNETLHNFDEQLVELSRELGTIKILSYLKYTGYKLNGTDLIESKMEEWKNATFKELNNQQMKLLEKANELINVFRKLSKKETNFEKEILKEIEKTKLSYGCCMKKFKFEIEGLECETQPPTTTALHRIPIHSPKSNVH